MKLKKNTLDTSFRYYVISLIIFELLKNDIITSVDSNTVENIKVGLHKVKMAVIVALTMT